MRIIISPAKKMRVDTDTFTCTEVPVFLEKTGILKDWIRSLSYEEQKALWACNDKIAKQNAERFADMDLHRNLTPALLAYDGIQYTYMAPAVFEDGQFDYVQEHLRILSGFYGVVKPMDGVVPYRLEMSAKGTGFASQAQAKGTFAGYRNLYDFWGDDLYREVMDGSRILINLASKEYSACIEKYLQPGDRYITCVFGELQGGKVVQKGVYAKMARGEMVRFLANVRAGEPEQIKAFNWSGYHFDKDRSSDTEYVFIRTEVPDEEMENRERAETSHFRKSPAGDSVPQHIYRMESILDNAVQKMDALEKMIAEYEAFQAEIEKLETYYTSPQWKADFASDEAGQYPDELKRGVLSEDGVWNMLERNRELLERIGIQRPDPGEKGKEK